jgi:hypothetical protein
MLRIEVAHTFDVSVTEAFAYITDVKNWPEYWPDFIRIENSAAACQTIRRAGHATDDAKPR